MPANRVACRARVLVPIALVALVAAACSSGTPSTPRTSGSSGPAANAQIIPSTPTGQTTVQQPPKRVPNTTGISGVLAWDTQGWPGDGTDHPGALEHDHVDGPVNYTITPPVGGPHNGIWMNAGVYTAPIPPERAVHNMEHGAVWITYDPRLPTSQVDALTAFVTKQSMIPESQQADGIANDANRFIDLSPWPTDTLPSKIVLSAWGHQLRVTSPGDPRMQQFVDTFRHSPKYSPEYGAAVDGIPIQTGGRPALDGSRQPNPPGTASGQGMH
ncbi:MAG TPA: DUF3105 domain-containing protein [Jatrophihabitantaceae bacterium]|nr:DUF3105 domain-containing protein [Jatrophihabitantaceae bacterium]